MIDVLTPELTKILKETITRIEALEVEKSDIQNDIKQYFEHAKENGLDVKSLRALIKRRKKSRQELQVEETTVSLYESALLSYEIRSL